MTLKVIGAGFGRTGTLSMKVALEKLGYNKCHHMLEVMSSARQVDLWYEIAQGGVPDWDAVFDGFAASVDFPSSYYYKELAQRYPDAKIVLTTRDFDRWYQSANETIWELSNSVPGWMKLIPRGRKTDRMVFGIVWDRCFGGRFEDKAHAESVFNDHIAEVKASVPEDRLLVMEVKDGWEPLCQFLGHEIPEEPFPHVNETDDFKKRIKLMKRLALVPWVLGAAALVAGYFLLQ